MTFGLWYCTTRYDGTSHQSQTRCDPDCRRRRLFAADGADEAGTVLELGAASAAATTFATGPVGLLKLDAAESFTRTVASFAAGDGIDMTDFLFANNPTLTVPRSGLGGTYTDATVHDGALMKPSRY